MNHILESFQKSYLKGLAHSLEPIVNIGKQGITPGFLVFTNHALDDHELIKIKFLDFKDQKKSLATEIAKQTDSMIVSIIGNNLILFRQNPDEENRKISLPTR
ncbi:MAG: YhbY family RNA-binding protein [Candidatus Marinimicrobia bacterium]|nr:YhbY family RNA-binding protein [Candidatus Neomarinimicrobiota bacterium]